MYHQARPAAAATRMAIASAIHFAPGFRGRATSVRSGCGFPAGLGSACLATVKLATSAVFMVFASGCSAETDLSAARALSLDTDQPIAIRPEA
jgi:hypothetical protein